MFRKWQFLHWCSLDISTIPIGSLWKLEITPAGTAITVIATSFCILWQAAALVLSYQGHHSENTLHFLNEAKVFDWTRQRL